MTETFYIPVGNTATVVKSRILDRLCLLSNAVPWTVMVTEKKPTRSAQQNALLWALYDDIIRRGGEALGGWTNKELHEHFLIERFGAIKLKAFGRTKLKPARRSSRMDKQTFSDFVEFIVRYMAEHGVVLSLPGDLS